MPAMMYLVYVAICLSTMAPRDCDRASAVDWVAAPEPQQGLSACMIQGIEYISQACLVQSGKTYPKVFCVPPTSIGKQNVG